MAEETLRGWTLNDVEAAILNESEQLDELLREILGTSSSSPSRRRHDSARAAALQQRRSPTPPSDVPWQRRSPDRRRHSPSRQTQHRQQSKRQPRLPHTYDTPASPSRENDDADQRRDDDVDLTSGVATSRTSRFRARTEIAVRLENPSLPRYRLRTQEESSGGGGGGSGGGAANYGRLRSRRGSVATSAAATSAAASAAAAASASMTSAASATAPAAAVRTTASTHDASEVWLKRSWSSPPVNRDKNSNHRDDDENGRDGSGSSGVNAATADSTVGVTRTGVDTTRTLTVAKFHVSAAGDAAKDVDAAVVTASSSAANDASAAAEDAASTASVSSTASATSAASGHRRSPSLTRKKAVKRETVETEEHTSIQLIAVGLKGVASSAVRSRGRSNKRPTEAKSNI